MNALYPFRFQPILRRYLWGGRRLGTKLGKPLGEGDDYAESWEIVDHGSDQSVVAAGTLAGTTLREIVAHAPEQLWGAGRRPPQFPLLFKFLDAHRTLSVQVHPDDSQAARLDPPDLGKTEAWYVLDAEPGSRIYAGLQRGVDRDTLQQAVVRGECERCLHSWEPQAGECIFIPAGTVHAIGAGLLIAEIQQASDTTFRLFDWNRVDAAGHPRALHIEQSLATIDYQRGPVGPQQPQSTSSPERVRLVDCEKFVFDRWQFEEPIVCGGDDRFHLLAIVEGKVQVAGEPSGDVQPLGTTLLLPAACGPTKVTPVGAAVVLDMYLPEPSPSGP